jgi:HlyD family secretion protein
MHQTLAEYNRAKAEHDRVEAPPRADELALAEGRVAGAEARLRLAQEELNKTRVVAPFSGRVLQVYVEAGEMANPTSAQPLLLLADLSKRRVRAFVEELDAARVQLGQNVRITADGLPGKEFSGKVGVVLPRMGKRSLQSDAAGEYKDLYFRETLIDLDTHDDVPLNLRVQVRFEVSPTAGVPGGIGN